MIRVGVMLIDFGEVWRGVGGGVVVDDEVS